MHSTGDILLGADRRREAAFHPILFIREHSPDYFVGVMLTHSPHFGNIPLPVHYFQNLTNYDPNNNHFVQCSLLKKNDWGPFRKVGELSPEGLDYVALSIDLENPVRWEEYNP